MLIRVMSTTVTPALAAEVRPRDNGPAINNSGSNALKPLVLIMMVVSKVMNSRRRLGKINTAVGPLLDLRSRDRLHMPVRIQVVRVAGGVQIGGVAAVRPAEPVGLNVPQEKCPLAPRPGKPLPGIEVVVENNRPLPVRNRKNGNGSGRRRQEIDPIQAVAIRRLDIYVGRDIAVDRITGRIIV